jgi:predicted O-methyltransferase YrrM
MTPRLYERLEIPDDRRDSSIRPEQAEYLRGFVGAQGCRRTMEVGLAFGCSAAHIIDATRRLHVAIDPFQPAYGNLGLANIDRLGWAALLELRAELSRVALPRLAAEGRAFDFVFIDGGHKFDEVLLDWALSDPLLERGGHVMFDDLWMRSVQHVVAFVERNCAHYRREQAGHRNVALFRKVADDRRDWNHFVEFCPAPVR